ncbi:MAG TPA: YicC/YloC family endoribonuclease [Chthoniobacterales bacterium]|nr:YicC/YloC family endoribonuclease [Chthoniobacterales bacterium]
MQSMTGYGRAQASTEEVAVVVEIQAVNKRQAEVILNLPDSLSPWEPEIRSIVDRTIGRGRITVNFNLEFTSPQVEPVLNRPLAKSYLAAFKALQSELRVNGEITMDTLLRSPGVIEQPATKQLSPKTRTPLLTALQAALDQLLAMRAKEGANLKRDLTRRIRSIRNCLHKVKRLRPRASERYRTNLHARIRKSGIDIPLDDDRLAKEVAFFSERSDFSEEITRLDSHLGQLVDTLEKKEPIGRTSEFLCQEIGRELNTLSAKANDAEISQLVVQAKSELEKVREQIQNVE